MRSPSQRTAVTPIAGTKIVSSITFLTAIHPPAHVVAPDGTPFRSAKTINPRTSARAPLPFDGRRPHLLSPLETQNSPTSLPPTHPGGRRERISGNGRMRGECFWPASDHQRPDKLPGLTWTSRGCGFHPSRRTVLPARPGPATLPVHEASEITLAAG